MTSELKRTDMVYAIREMCKTYDIPSSDEWLHQPFYSTKTWGEGKIAGARTRILDFFDTAYPEQTDQFTNMRRANHMKQHVLVFAVTYEGYTSEENSSNIVVSAMNTQIWQGPHIWNLPPYPKNGIVIRNDAPFTVQSLIMLPEGTPEDARVCLMLDGLVARPA